MRSTPICFSAGLARAVATWCRHWSNTVGSEFTQARVTSCGLASPSGAARQRWAAAQVTVDRNSDIRKSPLHHLFSWRPIAIRTCQSHWIIVERSNIIPLAWREFCMYFHETSGIEGLLWVLLLFTNFCLLSRAWSVSMQLYPHWNIIHEHIKSNILLEWSKQTIIKFSKRFNVRDWCCHKRELILSRRRAHHTRSMLRLCRETTRCCGIVLHLCPWVTGGLSRCKFTASYLFSSRSQGKPLFQPTPDGKTIAMRPKKIVRIEQGNVEK